MAYTVPNSFTTNTQIEADDIQENNDALRNYFNGIVTGKLFGTVYAIRLPPFYR